MTNLPHNFHLTQEGRDHLDSISKLTFDGRIDKHPLHQAIYDLCQEIEKLPASEQATKIVSAAAALHDGVAPLLARFDASSVTVTLQIGNSDDKLTQKEWHDFNYSVGEAVRQHASQVHFRGEPPSSERWQNTAWVFVIEVANIPGLKNVVAYLRAEFRQDSVAWTEGETLFV